MWKRRKDASTEVILHVGPHKTGTTSLQYFLKKCFGAKDPQPIWFPTGDAIGPAGGHGPLALPFSEIKGYADAKKGIKQLQDIVSSCNMSSVQKLIISSEDFVWGIDKNLEMIRDVLKPRRIHLIFTINGLARRLLSHYSSRLQFGHTDDLESSLTKIMQQPGLQSNIFERHIKAIEPDETSVICIDRSAQPDFLLCEFAKICGLPDSGIAPEFLIRRNR